MKIPQIERFGVFFCTFLSRKFFGTDGRTASSNKRSNKISNNIFYRIFTQ